MQPVTASHSVGPMPLGIANKCVSGAKKRNPKQAKNISARASVQACDLYLLHAVIFPQQ